MDEIHYRSPCFIYKLAYMQERTCAHCGNTFVPRNAGKGRGKFCGWDCCKMGRAYRSTHGFARTPTYYAWMAMRQRCNNQRNQSYADYGGRGIRVCERWQAFENFLSDMGEQPVGMWLDRLDNNGNYEPGNCAWRTPRQQLNNTRKTVLLTFNGHTQSISAWARETSINGQLITYRITHGWTVAEALTTKPRHGYRHGRAS